MSFKTGNYCKIPWHGVKGFKFIKVKPRYLSMSCSLGGVGGRVALNFPPQLNWPPAYFFNHLLKPTTRASAFVGTKQAFCQLAGPTAIIFRSCREKPKSGNNMLQRILFAARNNGEAIHFFYRRKVVFKSTKCYFNQHFLLRRKTKICFSDGVTINLVKWNGWRV